MYLIRHTPLFSCEEFFTERDDNSRLMMVMTALPDAELLGWLQAQRGKARDDSGKNCKFALQELQALPIIKLRRTLKGDEICRRRSRCATNWGHRFA